MHRCVICDVSSVSLSFSINTQFNHHIAGSTQLRVRLRACGDHVCLLLPWYREEQDGGQRDLQASGD